MNIHESMIENLLGSLLIAKDVQESIQFVTSSYFTLDIVILKR